MTREQAQLIVAEIELRLARNRDLTAELEELKALVAAPKFATTAARILVEKMMQRSSKKLRGVLYNAITTKAARLNGWKQNRMERRKPSQAAVTNITVPWQGGAPGSGKRS